MAAKKAKAKKKGAAKVAPLATQSLHVVVTVPARYGDRIEGMFDRAIDALRDQIADAQIDVEISNLKKGG